MSTFCGVVSNNPSPPEENDRPMQFFDLELITDSLLRDVDDMKDEFKLKAASIVERDKNIAINAGKIIEAEKAIQTLNSDCIKVEMELEGIEEDLQKLERTVESVEKSQNLQLKASERKVAGERVCMFHMLEEMSKGIDEVKELTKQTEEAERIVRKVNPIHSVVELMGLHTKIIMNLDKNVDTLASKLCQAKESLPQLPSPKK